MALGKVRPEQSVAAGGQSRVGNPYAVDVVVHGQEMEGGVPLLKRHAVQLGACCIQGELVESQVGEFTQAGCGIIFKFHLHKTVGRG